MALSIKKLTLDYTKFKMMDVALEARENLQNDDLGPFDWFAIKSYMMSLKNMELEGVHPHPVSSRSSNLALMNLQAARACLLMVAQAAYKRMLDDGWVTQITPYLLMGSVDDAMDSVSREPLCDWERLESSPVIPAVHFFEPTRLQEETFVNIWIGQG